jgi:hypothetical protein
MYISKTERAFRRMFELAEAWLGYWVSDQRLEVLEPDEARLVLRAWRGMPPEMRRSLTEVYDLMLAMGLLLDGESLDHVRYQWLDDQLGDLIVERTAS